MSLGLDVHSYSNYDEVTVTHLYPHLTIDFNRQILFGYTDITFQRKKESATFVRLDTKGLSIERVSYENNDIAWTMPKYHASLGSCLEIALDDVKKNDFVIRVFYSTSTVLSGGIQWFDPVQTADKKHPFMYTQFEAILARTMIPCQDIPAVKAPYDIEITCPSPLVAACSGVQVGEATKSTQFGSEWLTYKFEQKMPIPSYLIALACGGIQRKAIGTRTGVWAESSLMAASEKEFVDTETFLEKAEKIAGLDYNPLWSHYDLLVLPSAFPYGGMENPSLTFISSSLITGDKDLVDVVAHEIAHSWSGNLVTNATWGDFWLNEGFTMYLERLILGEVHDEKMRQFHIILGFQDLQKTIAELKDHKEFQKLVPDLTGVDPDEAFSRVPYEKGCSLLVHLEQLVKGKDNMVAWLRKYFAKYARTVVSTKEMIAHFSEHFPEVKVDWDTWLNGTGMPASYDPRKILPLGKSVYDQCEKLAQKWQAGGEGASIADITGKEWDSSMTMCFIDILINDLEENGKKLSVEVLKKMGDVYKLNATKNVEIMIRWIMLNLGNENVDKEFMDGTVIPFLGKHGRGVYVKPTYGALIRLSKEGKIPSDDVKAIWKKFRSGYHSVIRNAFDAQLGK